MPILAAEQQIQIKLNKTGLDIFNRKQRLKPIDIEIKNGYHIFTAQQIMNIFYPILISDIASDYDYLKGD